MQPTKLVLNSLKTNTHPTVSNDSMIAKINVFYFNSRSIKNKLTELHHELYSLGHEIICITETWLDKRITDRMLDPQHKYSIFRCDREGGRSAGVSVS